MNDCLFCKIIAGEIPSSKVYEDEYVYAFNDISPKAPVHVLIVPKEHVKSAAELEGKGYLAAHVFDAVVKIVKQLNITEGFRVVTNSGRHGCQSVEHLHFHLLAGKQLSEDM